MNDVELIKVCEVAICVSSFSGISVYSQIHLDEVAAAKCCWILIGEKSNICTSASRVTLLTNFTGLSLVTTFH